VSLFEIRASVDEVTARFAYLATTSLLSLEMSHQIARDQFSRCER
jgi:hypothetical protein